MVRTLYVLAILAAITNPAVAQVQEFPSAAEAIAKQAKAQFEKLLEENPHELAARARQLGNEIQVTAKYGIEVARTRKRLELSERFRIESVNELDTIRAQAKDLKMMLQAEVDKTHETTKDLKLRNQQIASIATAFKPQLDDLYQKEAALEKQVKATREFIAVLDQKIANLEREIRLTKKGFSPTKTLAVNPLDIKRMYGLEHSVEAPNELFAPTADSQLTQTAAIKYLEQIGITSK